MKILRAPTLALALASTCAFTTLLGACANPEKSAEARPVLYPNAPYQAMGDAAARAIAENCMASARAQGISPSNNAVESSAGRGAATLGVMSAVGALVTGGNLNSAMRAGAEGAAVGGAGGAVSGAYDARYNPTYRRFVDICLSERGLRVIGWQ